jgi:ribosomal-protein-alanine N-acetyltransferase
MPLLNPVGLESRPRAEMAMRAGIRIERMRESDVRSVAAIGASSQLRENMLREELERPWSHMWVAQEVGAASQALVGFLALWHVADELHVLNLLTREDRRRLGIGRALMETALAFAREKRAKQVLLEVRCSNASAIALYRKVGFHTTRLRARYYADDEDAVEMTLQLDPSTGEVVAREDEAG